ncbi:hypothetical protein, partial [Streptomyces sp. Ru73]|uniref:hypothetical protein n=1 Tax=Streptomyces sp. Ru73 TaxID=2080748 RepID=UPI00215610DA
AGHLRTTGADVHSHFQGLSAFYKAPEAEKLFATTKPVKDRADEFADGLETVASALSAYADEIRPLVPKLAALKTKAQNFIRDHKDDEDGDYDEDLIHEHNQIRDDITATVAAFWAAERTCHNKITALWHGTQMVAGDGSDKQNQYGFNAADMKNAKLPWGDPVEEKHHWYEVGHWVKSFVWDGLIVDGIWGTIKGLGTLVGFGGWDAMGQAWKGLAQLATGLAISSIPGVGTAFWALPDDKMPSWLRDSRTAMKETGKALVAWDEWGKNPGRAAGAVTFNVLTTVFTGGAGGAAAGAGKAGAVAKALSVAGKAGKVIDPMTYVAKGAGAGLSKVGDIAKSIKGIGKIDVPALPADAIKLPEGALKLPDGTVHLPEGAAVPEGATRLPDGNVKLPDDVPALPENATKLPTGTGEPARYFDGDGNLLDEHGNVLDSIDNAPKEGSPHAGPPAGSDLPRVDADSPAKVPAMAGAGAHAADDAAHIRLGGSFDTQLGDAGRLGDDATTPAGHVGDTPGGHAPGHLGDTPGNGLPGRIGDTPGGTADHLPGGTAHDLGHGPSAGHEPPTGGGHPGGHGDGPGGHNDGPGGHNDGPGTGGGHEGPASGGHGEGPGAGGHEGAPGGHEGSGGGNGPGDGPGGSHDPSGDGDRFSEGDRTATGPTGPMSPDQEAAVTAGLDRAKMAPQDQQRLLTQLRKGDYGAQVAEYIARGDFDGMPGYGELLSQCKQKGMLPAVHQAMEFAADLKSRGVDDLAFEYKNKGQGLDLDVLVKSGDDIKYGCQLKDVGQEHSIGSAARKIADKQLAGQISGPKVAILDVHDTRAALTEATIKDVEHYAKKTGATFELRFKDGSVTIPANGQVYP